MKDSQQSKDKIYYTMGEVCDMFGVNASLIRFWEREMSVLRPKRNTKGNRLFTKKDLETLKLVYYLIKEKGMTLAGADKHLRQNREGIAREAEVVEHLLRVRAMLTELRTELGGEENVVAEFDDEPADDFYPFKDEGVESVLGDEEQPAEEVYVEEEPAEDVVVNEQPAEVSAEEQPEEVIVEEQPAEVPMEEVPVTSSFVEIELDEKQPAEEKTAVTNFAEEQVVEEKFAEEPAVDEGKPRRRIVEQTLF